MSAKTSNQDRRVNLNVIRQLASHGIRPPCNVVAVTSDGSTTLTGQIEHEHQRHSAVRAAQNTAGVKRVVDQLQVMSKRSHRQDRGFNAASLQF